MDTKISFEEYKRLTNLDDIEKFSKNLKPFWWENFPILGSIIYGIRHSIKMAGIDRGLLRKQITIVNMIFAFSFLIYPYAIITLLTPWFSYWIFKTAIKRAQKKIQENNPIQV